MILVIRNATWLLCTLIIPFVKYNDELLETHNETKNCIKRLELILSSKLGYLYFVSYVESLSNDHKDIIHLFNLLLTRKEKEKERDNWKEVEVNIIRLHSISNTVKEVFEEAKSDIKDHTYDKVILTVMQRLNKYFESFIKSEYYSELHEKVLLKEIINERLRQADLI
jgi:hypothetical protein